MFPLQQDILKSLLADKQFNDKHRLGAVNSINWARILVQIVYYFSAYFQLLDNPNVDVDRSEIQFVVPTGNFGDILAGYYAKRMGLPMGKLGVATNSNDILARFWRSGTYQKVDPAAGPVAGGVHATVSPAMDIAVSSNFERLLWYLAYQSARQSDETSKRAAACDQVRNWMVGVKNRGTVDLSTVLEEARRDFVADKADDEQVGFNVDLDVQLVDRLTTDDRHHQEILRDKVIPRRPAHCCGATRRRGVCKIQVSLPLLFLGYHTVDSVMSVIAPAQPFKSSFPPPTLPSLPRLFRRPTLRLIPRRCSVTCCRVNVA